MTQVLKSGKQKNLVSSSNKPTRKEKRRRNVRKKNNSQQDRITGAYDGTLPFEWSSRLYQPRLSLDPT